jgi:hydrogenase-4 component F
MAALLIVIFAGFMNHFRGMYFGPGRDERGPAAVSPWCAAPMWLALVPLLVLGLWWPASPWHYLASIAGPLSAGLP